MRRIVLDMQCELFAEAICQTLKNGLIDNFIYGSISPEYFSAVIDAL